MRVCVPQERQKLTGRERKKEDLKSFLGAAGGFLRRKCRGQILLQKKYEAHSDSDSALPKDKLCDFPLFDDALLLRAERIPRSAWSRDIAGTTRARNESVPVAAAP